MEGNGVMREYTMELFGYPISCAVTRLDQGVHVLLTGGCRSHIGAVSLAGPGQGTRTQVFPGHKDQHISEPWAKAISERSGERTCVVCGIHYDNADQAQIREILRETELLLAQILAEL